MSVQVARAVTHPALVPVERVLAASDGLVIVSPWFDGDLLRSPADRRDQPDEPGNRFARLPVAEVEVALDQVIDLHVRLEAAGWIAGDLYDGSLMYDFAHRTIKVIDVESYHRGPYVNAIGRLPGSTRFMAPEEFVRGDRIDARTTVFTLGRMLQTFLVRAHPGHPAAAVAEHATQSHPDDRPSSLARFQEQWRAATG
ncbi:hypothetical protein [Nocardioides sp. SYSU D00065]|uniref:hypothetical protein n=1 Tax=Nocardioides sp. SYSU D00065 TaxID=2817378 RepID=UPI001B3382C2|nr:hypothetical protein [Nocardioides sp. SYSU D00065]